MNTQQQQETIERNEEFLRITVSRFMSKCRQSNRNGVLSREDLMQEVTISFLEEVEKNGEEIALTHRRTYIHAMYDAVRKAYPLSISYHAFNAERQAIHIEQWEEMEKYYRWEDTSSKVIERLSLFQKLEELNEHDRQIIRWRLEGLSQREIAKRIGLTDVQMCREMKRIKAEITTAQ